MKKVSLESIILVIPLIIGPEAHVSFLTNIRYFPKNYTIHQTYFLALMQLKTFRKSTFSDPF